MGKLTPPRLAKRWGVSYGTVLGLIKAGRLRAINVSSGSERRRWLIDEDDAAAFEQANESCESLAGGCERWEIIGDDDELSDDQIRSLAALLISAAERKSDERLRSDREEVGMK